MLGASLQNLQSKEPFDVSPNIEIGLLNKEIRLDLPPFDRIRFRESEQWLRHQHRNVRIVFLESLFLLLLQFRASGEFFQDRTALIHVAMVLLRQIVQHRLDRLYHPRI